jgi:hypothetical protein
MGYRIDQHGPAADPRARLLTDALRATEPVAAAVLASPAEPDVARVRAFLHLARAAALLSPPQRDALAAALATAPQRAQETDASLSRAHRSRAPISTTR